jgi:hypothetical protein
MPTFDGGHYFLTVLVPVITDCPISDGSAFTSPVHALRKRLATLPPAQQTPTSCGDQSPFARNTRNHFVRFAIIDDVAYNGRQHVNLVWSTIKNIDTMVAQPQDHLTCPFLFFGADFDAASGSDAERDSYLAALWDTMQTELKEIFKFCIDFDPSVNDAASFAKYIARGQIETTMSFNDYYAENIDDTIKSLPAWPYDKYLIPAFFGLLLLLLGFGALFFSGGAGPVLLLLGAAAFGAGICLHNAGPMAAGAVLSALGLVVLFFSAGVVLMVLLLGAATFGGGIWLAYSSIMAAGAKPFPPAADLPAVLKALHLQRAFTRFAIDNQLLAVNPASAEQLRAAFRDFVAENQPDNLGVINDQPDPHYTQTQKPGVIGI